MKSNGKYGSGPKLPSARTSATMKAPPKTVPIKAVIKMADISTKTHRTSGKIC